MAKEHILVVEDEEDIQELERYNLEKEGYRVTTVATGEAGLERARKEVPDLILEVEDVLEDMFPEAVVAGQAFILGPGEPGKIRVRITGPDSTVLRELAARALGLGASLTTRHMFYAEEADRALQLPPGFLSQHILLLSDHGHHQWRP